MPRNFQFQVLNQILVKFFAVLNHSCSQQLYYDFNLSLGDTLVKTCAFRNPHVPFTYDAIVSSITEEFIFGQNRKVFHVDNGFFRLIEGFGLHKGLFLPSEDEGINAGGLWQNLSAYCVGELEECNLFVSNKELIHSSIISVFSKSRRWAIQHRW